MLRPQFTSATVTSFHAPQRRGLPRPGVRIELRSAGRHLDMTLGRQRRPQASAAEAGRLLRRIIGPIPA